MEGRLLLKAPGRSHLHGLQEKLVGRQMQHFSAAQLGLSSDSFKGFYQVIAVNSVREFLSPPIIAF